MYHPHFQLHFAKQREKELLEKARKAYPLTEFKAEKPGFRARLLIKSGAILILIGQKLQASYENEAQLARQHTTSESVPGH